MCLFEHTALIVNDDDDDDDDGDFAEQGLGQNRNLTQALDKFKVAYLPVQPPNCASCLLSAGPAVPYEFEFQIVSNGMARRLTCLPLRAACLAAVLLDSLQEKKKNRQQMSLSTKLIGRLGMVRGAMCVCVCVCGGGIRACADLLRGRCFFWPAFAGLTPWRTLGQRPARFFKLASCLNPSNTHRVIVTLTGSCATWRVFAPRSSFTTGPKAQGRLAKRLNRMLLSGSRIHSCRNARTVA